MCIRDRSGSDTELNVKLRYLGNDFEKEFGNKIEFHSAGNLRYVINGNATEGIFSTTGVAIHAKGVKELPDITLTAAPDRLSLIHILKLIGILKFIMMEMI